MAKEYFISKLSFKQEEKLIDCVFSYEYDGHNLSDGEEHKRHWIVNRLQEGSSVSTLLKNSKGAWTRGNPFRIESGNLKWNETLPENITKRKTFVSYYHKDDQEYRELFEKLFGDLIVSKSVDDGDIESDNSDEYIKQLIQKDYLKDTTVLVVLIGPKTKCRKHVDWELAGALSSRLGGVSGIIGILLPTHPDYGEGKKWNAENLPKRLAANVLNGYGAIYDWTIDRVEMQKRFERAFASKSDTSKLINKSIPQMIENTCK